MTALLVLSQLVIAAVMTGIIWQVQLLTYPQFHQVPSDAFANFHRAHTQRTGWLVGPPMLLELALAGWTLWRFWSPESVVGFLLVAAIWLTTGLLQVPMHRRLEAGKNERIIRALVLSNWIRTALWTARLGWLAAWVLGLDSLL